MRLGGLLLLIWLYAMTACANEQERQYLHEIRTRSALVCSSALLYFNPALKAPDVRALASSYESLNLLGARSVQLGRPELLAALVSDMQHLFKDLERLPRQEAAQYPRLLVQLLQLQRDMDTWAGKQLSTGGIVGNSVAQTLRQQSLAMARLLLDYQVRTYPFASGEFQGLTTTERQALDRDLNEGLQYINDADASLAGVISAVHRSYRFVRSQVLASQPRQSVGGVEFYLSRGVIDMDELVAQASIGPIE